MTEEIKPIVDVPAKKKKTVSYSQFSNFYTCEYRYFKDYILNEKKFEDSLNMSFGTAIHETIQLYLRTLYDKSEKLANKIDMPKYFAWAFNRQIVLKKIPHTPAERDEFIEDGKNILNEFKDPANRLKHFSKKWELLAIEDELRTDIRNNVSVVGYLDLVLREKATGKVKILDLKTTTHAWKSQKEDFTKCSQLVFYKALYSKINKIPLSKIDVEFFIMRRKLYENAKYEQSRIEVFKPASHMSDITETLDEFEKFVKYCFTEGGEYQVDKKYHKMPGLNRKNCKYCLYAKNGTCDRVPDKLDKD